MKVAQFYMFSIQDDRKNSIKEFVLFENIMPKLQFFRSSCKIFLKMFFPQVLNWKLCTFEALISKGR